MALKQDEHVLFYGDSITDAGRRSKDNNNGGLGVGYPAMIAARLAAAYPEMNLRFTNTGISGNRAKDLLARMDADLLAHKPTLVSVLIGINDTWRAFDANDPTPVDAFRKDYRAMLRRIVDELGARLVLCEPFLLHTPADRAKWRSDLNPRIDAVRELAREFHATYLPLDGLFAAAACRREMAYWLPDGVHPSQAGHTMIADAWIREVTA